MSQPSAEDVIGSMMADQVEQIKKGNDAAVAGMQKTQLDMQGVYQKMFERFTEPSKQAQAMELPPDIAEIVAVLRAQPRLVPYVKLMLQAKVAEINAAVDQILGAVPPSPPTS